MKYLLALLLLIPFIGFAQQGDDSTKYIYYRYQYGQRMQRYWADSALHIPFLDTTNVKPEKPGAIMICSCDTLFYKWDGFGWQSISGSGGTWGSITGTLSDQTDLQAALDAKLSTVSTDATLTGDGTSGDPLSVVPDSIVFTPRGSSGDTVLIISNDTVYHSLLRDSTGITIDRATDGALVFYSSGSSGVSIGDAVGSGTSGSVLYVDASGNLAQNNTLLNWDNSSSTFTTANILPDANTRNIGASTSSDHFNSIFVNSIMMNSSGTPIANQFKVQPGFILNAGTTPSATGADILTFQSSNSAATSGITNFFHLAATNFQPASGNGIFNLFNLAQTINQTGGTGVTRYLYLNPTLTAAADFRAIELTQNSHWGIYQSGSSAKNYFAGENLIGSTTDFGSHTLQNTGGFYQNGSISLNAVPTGTASMNVLLHHTDSNVYKLPMSSLAINLATDNLTQDAEARTYNSNTQNLTFSNSAIFTVSATDRVLLSATNYTTAGAGFALAHTTHGDADLTVTTAHSTIYQDTITADRTFTMPSILTGGTSHQFKIKNDNYENGFHILLAGTELRDVDGSTLTQLENKTVYLIENENNVLANYWKVINKYSLADNFVQTYTPTGTNVTNIAGSTISELQYIKNGNSVAVWGVIGIDPTSTGDTQIDISLPPGLASNFTTSGQASGNGATYEIAGGSISIYSNSTDDRISIRFVAADTDSHSYNIHFTYTIL